jgi:hypothetical protein
MPFLPFPQKSMTAKTLSFLFAVALVFTACSHSVAPLGHYQSTPVTANGIPDEWILPLRFANASYTLQYNITNDSRNIYICALSRDEETILRMLRAGITVYFDPKGQNSRDISLHYPLRKQPDPNTRDRKGEPLTSQSDSGWKEELLRQSDSYGTTGFSGIENGQFAITDTKSPLRVAIQLSHHDSLLVYEAIIPIENIVGTAALSSRNPRKPFSVGVILNTPSGQTVAGSPHHSANGHGLGLGMNGMHMGGGHRNYNQNQNNYDNPPIKEDANWYQFRLATAAPGS